jgi:hypothetical protein
MRFAEIATAGSRVIGIHRQSRLGPFRWQRMAKAEMECRKTTFCAVWPAHSLLYVPMGSG